MSNATHFPKLTSTSAEPVQHNDTVAPPVDVYETAMNCWSSLTSLAPATTESTCNSKRGS